MTEAKSTQPANLPVTVHGSDGPCGRCGYSCECWFTNSHLWNQVNGGETGLLCLRCFVEQAEAMGLKSFAWRLVLDAPPPENSGSAQTQLPPRLELRPTCPLCKGIGKKTVIGFNNKPVLHTCSLCKGTGKLYLPVDELTELYEKLEAENESLKAQLEERNNRGTGFLYVPKAAYEVVKAERDLLRSEATENARIIGMSGSREAAWLAERDKMLEVIREYRERLGRYNHGLDCLGAGACGVTDDRCPICIKADALLKDKV